MQARNWLPVVIIIPVLATLILASCRGSAPAKISPLACGGTEVLKNVYDDQQSTVYIKSSFVNKDRCCQDGAISDIMTRKKEWSQKFPTKEVVTMSVVYDFSAWNEVTGLLIHYKQN